MYNHDETIAAISTPPGKGGVALIRVSGQEAVAVASRCLHLRSGKALADLPANRTAYADFLDGETPIDDVLVTLFRAPHSFTGEDTVEISCHGGILLTGTILSLLLSHGARQAEAGEFTRRALLSGKLSLSEAEAIGCLLEAESEAQIRLSASPARTHLANKLAALRGGMLELISSLYAKIDYPDEDLADVTDAEMQERLASLISETERLLATYRTGRAVNEGIPTVLCGAPNVGKSSLYNLLAGEELAIVTAHAGTTRDVLSTTLPAGKVLLRLSDTAGLREATDPVEQIGVERSRDRMEAAELLLAVFDGTRVLQEEDRALIAALKESGKCVIAIVNKSDEKATLDQNELRAALPHVVSMSAKTGKGQSELIALIESLFTDGEIVLGEDAVIASARQFGALSRVREALSAALDAGHAGMPADFCSSDLERALSAFSELDGCSVSEEIVSEIFRRFCVGK